MENLAEILDERQLEREALDNFTAILEDADYATVLDSMGIGRLQFLARKQMRVELAGLYTALWRLALGRSFPERADAMFAEFLDSWPRTHPGKIGQLTMERAAQYWGMLEPGGDTDFSCVARHLISFLVKEQRDTRALTLKLALLVRRIYCTIFERLI